MTLTISQLWVYPIKSCQGVSISQTTLLPSGLQHDREMMIIDTKGQFVTQRSDAVLATIVVDLVTEGIRISHDQNTLIINPRFDKPLNTTVWRRQVPAYDQGDAASDFLSNLIGRRVRLVATRPSDTLTAERGILFQDGQAIHLLTEASLRHAQQHLPDIDVDARRFRPNIVIADNGELSPFAEDHWQTILTPGCALAVEKLCERCNIPTINPDTLTVNTVVSDYFNRYRLIGGRPMFGICGRGAKLGQLRVGDSITVTPPTP